MKLMILSALLSLLFLPCCAVVSAETTSEPHSTSTERINLIPVSLDKVKTMIRQKETFYLYIGRQDFWQGTMAYQKVAQVATVSGQTVYYLDTKGIPTKAYKAFATKYRIKSPTYLAKFGQKQQLKQLTALENVSDDVILAFLRTD